jgi:hypothetical protein
MGVFSFWFLVHQYVGRSGSTGFFLGRVFFQLQ